MSLLKWIGAIVAIILILVVGFMGYMGLLTPGDVVEREMGPYTFVYEEFTGPYQDTGPVFDQVYKKLEADGIKTTLGIGIYYDDPATVPADKLRSHVGAVIEVTDPGTLATLKEKYKVDELKRGKSAVFTFPIRNNLSYMFGPGQGYPALVKFMDEKKYKMTVPFEIYDMEKKEIYYVMMVETGSP